VAVTSPRRSLNPLVGGLAAAGADVVEAPLIAIADPESWAPLDSALEQLAAGSYVWLVVASGNAATRIVARLGLAGHQIPSDTRVATVGPGSAVVLRKGGIDVDVIAWPQTSEALVAAIGDGRGRVLLPRVAKGPREFADSLAVQGWEVHEVPAYRNVPVGPHSPGLDPITGGDFHIITLTSGSAARNLAALVPPSSIGLQPGGDPAKAVACIGPATAAAARAVGLRVDVVAESHTLPGLVEAIIANLRGMAR
jgi:uroporphyrinogen-III synthase